MKKTIRIPEKLKVLFEKNGYNFYDESDFGDKINELIDYLKEKEDKL